MEKFRMRQGIKIQLRRLSGCRMGQMEEKLAFAIRKIGYESSSRRVISKAHDSRRIHAVRFQTFYKAAAEFVPANGPGNRTGVPQPGCGVNENSGGAAGVWTYEVARSAKGHADPGAYDIDQQFSNRGYFEFLVHLK